MSKANFGFRSLVKVSNHRWSSEHLVRSAVPDLPLVLYISDQQEKMRHLSVWDLKNLGEVCLLGEWGPLGKACSNCAAVCMSHSTVLLKSLVPQWTELPDVTKTFSLLLYNGDFPFEIVEFTWRLYQLHVACVPIGLHTVLTLCQFLGDFFVLSIALFNSELQKLNTFCKNCKGWSIFGGL